MSLDNCGLTTVLTGMDIFESVLYSCLVRGDYSESHPWITFTYDAPHHDISMRMGEAYSKCSHLAGTPLMPSTAQQFARIYLVKGVNATTAIEGNTLSEDEVEDILDKTTRLPRSQEYLQREIENVAGVITRIYDTVEIGVPFTLTPQWLSEVNRDILAGIEVAEHVVPGEYTLEKLLVGSVYRGAPPEDIPMLVDRLCDWINQLLSVVGRDDIDDDVQFVNVFRAAVLAHLYIAWIHPFGDGNGRTARALECAILRSSGLVPWVSCNVLSNFYNRTRTRYYDKLNLASRRRDVEGFVRYAADGFVDELRQQIAYVQGQQRRVSWVSYVHEIFQTETQGDASRRRRELLLALPENVATPRSRVRRLTPELAEMYSDRSDKTVSHDINRLRELNLLAVTQAGIRPRVEAMDAFLPENHWS